MAKKKRDTISRRSFISTVGAGSLLLLQPSWNKRLEAAPAALANIFHVEHIPLNPFGAGGNRHAGVETLLPLLESQGLAFYRSTNPAPLTGPEGMIAAADVVLIKVNAQWKYRGCTNSDVIRGLVQRVLEHPDGFSGEVVIVENGQGRGSLNCNTYASYGNSEVHANALNESHSFVYLADHVFADPRVSTFLFDPIRSVFIGADDHVTNGYRHFENVSYPCFTTAGGRRVELRDGIWTGSGYSQGLKLINVPVLKHHDSGGSEITSALKLMYGMVSMADGNSDFRHYAGLGETCGKMMVSVRPPVLNIIDAIWVSQASISGFPATATRQCNALVASQDPVALDYWAAKHVLYPLDGNPSHHPDHENIQRWLAAAESTINGRGGLYHPEWGIQAGTVTRSESNMAVHYAAAGPADALALTSPNGGESWTFNSQQNVTWNAPGLAGNVALSLYRNGRKVGWIANCPATRGSYSWKVGTYEDALIPVPAGGGYAIQVTGSGASDMSDGTFSIYKPIPSLELTSPKGGESWRFKSQQYITWKTSSMTGNVALSLYRNGRKVGWIANCPAMRGSYSWKVGTYEDALIPVPAGSGYSIVITRPGLAVASAGTFTIFR